MENQLQVLPDYNLYPDVIKYDIKNPYIHSPNADYDIYFYQTKETLADVEIYREFIKNAENRFRRSAYYKTYKSYLIDLGLDRGQVMGNITTEDATIELHHNILNLFDITLMICEHVINTVGVITTFDLVQILIMEHMENRIPITFLPKTAHQMYTGNSQSYIPPNMTFGKWWELLYRYRYGITLEIAYKIVNYIRKYQNELPISIDIQQQEQILNFAYYNDYGYPAVDCGAIPIDDVEDGYYE